VLSQNKLCSQKKVSIVTAIAVVGIGCRLPGYVDSPDALGGALLAGIDFVTDIPQQRWNADDYYEPVAGAPGRSVSRWGAFLDDPSGFDHRFFGIGEPDRARSRHRHPAARRGRDDRACNGRRTEWGYARIAASRSRWP
jgi:polyketide synthase 5